MSLFEIRLLMREKNISSIELASRMGISYLQLNRKLDGEVEFSANEINRLAIILGKREIAFIFFG